MISNATASPEARLPLLRSETVKRSCRNWEASNIFKDEIRFSPLTWNRGRLLYSLSSDLPRNWNRIPRALFRFCINESGYSVNLLPTPSGQAPKPTLTRKPLIASQIKPLDFQLRKSKYRSMASGLENQYKAKKQAMERQCPMIFQPFWLFE